MSVTRSGMEIIKTPPQPSQTQSTTGSATANPKKRKADLITSSASVSSSATKPITMVIDCEQKEPKKLYAEIEKLSETEINDYIGDYLGPKVKFFVAPDCGIFLDVLQE